jgi:hypothetical protein
MRQQRAIVIMYIGEEPSVQMVENIVQQVAINCNAQQNVGVQVYSPKDISNILVGNVAKITEETTKDEERTPEDQAIIYLGTVLKDALEAPFNEYNLMLGLTLHIQKVKATESEEEIRKLMNALFILSRENLVVSKSLMNKYHFTAKKISTIRKVYNFVTNL